MRIRILSVVALLTLVWPASARAGTITIENVGHFTGVGTTYLFAEDPSMPPESFSQILGSVTMSGGTGLGALDGITFEAYCVDLIGPIDFSGTVGEGLEYTATADEMANWEAPTALNSPEARQRASYLYNTFASTFTPSQLTERSALQMAIWEVLYDTTPNVLAGSPGAGRFAVSNASVAVQTLATTYLTTMLANPLAVAASNATWLRLSLDGDETIQDFIGPRTSDQSVPEPSAGLLLGMGMMGIAAFRSRKSLLRRS